MENEDQSRTPRTSAPPQNLRFVVANDPDQFRDRSIMRNNRSHVMHNHLSEKRQQEAPRGQVEGSRVSKASRSTTPSRAGSRVPSPSSSQTVPKLERAATEQTISSSEALAIYRRTQDPKPRRRTTASSDADVRPSRRDSSRSTSRPLESPKMYSRSGSVPLVTSPAAMPLPPPAGLLYCDSQELAAALNEMNIQWRNSSTSSLGRPLALQEVSSRPKISIDVLRFYCLNAIRETGSAFFASPRFQSRDWIKLLGALSLAAPDVTLALQESPLGTASEGTNAEAMNILQHCFQDPEARVNDATVMAVLFLIARSTVSGEHSLARVHEEGLLRMLQLMGDWEQHSPGLANATLSIVSLSAILTERQLDSFWIQQGERKDRSSARVSQRGPHSPLLFPPSGFGLLFDHEICKERTHSVLRSACELTTHASEAVNLRYSDIFDPSFNLQAQNIQRQSDIDRTINELATNVYALGHQTHENDFVFEACRIAAGIYATAISRRMPFAQAANIMSYEGIRQMPVESLILALQRTDVGGCWDNMCGVLLWTSLVGGSAAQDPQARSWLLGIVLRCCIVLLVERSDSVVESFRSLSQVMQLWDQGSETLG